ncbi:two-component system response regulator [Sinorhizobium glycinis]|uniref:Regulatory protein VirG n=1 Tax=Sinorhizobium glycinis TaxID=1472378 RepID=A0A178XH18_9HYPH|nr:response regulator [Sinorhizobium glycinis]OAP34547.1 two-component system response regulator [Sinorhizobium glycinis]
MSPGSEPTLPRVIVVDDEQDLRDMVADYLTRNGFAVRTAGGSAALDRALATEEADLILLDVNMPDEDGFSIARRLAGTSNAAIIMLTAADDVVDRIVGLEVGADDYLSKPFDLRELKARARAVLRRSRRAVQPVNGGSGQATPNGMSHVPFGKALIDLDARCLVQPDGTRETLTAMEFDLIDVFLQNPHRILTRNRLLDLAHRRDNDPFDRSIDVRVTRIRKKIEADPSKPQTIKTVRGAGYIFTPGKDRA